MKPDVMNMLRAANPVPAAARYDEERVADQVERITDTSADPAEIMVLDRPREVRPRRWSVPVAAAAVVLTVGGGAVVANRHHAAGGARSVSCQVAATGSSSVSDRLVGAQEVISRRVHEAGGRADSFHRDLSGRRITFTAHNIDRLAAAGACTATTFAVQSPVTAPVPVSATGTRSGNPLTAIGFAVPANEYEYSQLSAADRARLAVAMARFDCSTGHREAPTLACGVVGGRTVVYLLSPAVATGKNLAATGASAPSAAASAQWTVQLVFDPAGTVAISHVTAAHHSSAANVTVADCSSRGVSCANFLALTVDGRVRYATQTRAGIEATMKISGVALTRSSATALTVDLDAARVGLSPARGR